MRLYPTSPSSPTRLGYDGLDLLTEYQLSGPQYRRYVHGPGMDEPLVMYMMNWVAGTFTRRWYHADERGTIVQLSDEAGNAWQTNRYDKYGKPAATNWGKFGYTGQTWHGEIGAYNYKNRIYSADTGRFLQTDPIGYGDGMNLYAYVGNDPVNFTDPLGNKRTRIREGALKGQVRDLVNGPVPTLFEDLDGVYGYDENGRKVYLIRYSPRIPHGGLNISEIIIRDKTFDLKLSLDGNDNNAGCSGSVRAEGVNLTGIFGLGLTVSFGQVTVNASGESSWFFTAGVGAGFDAGIAGFVTRYDSLSSFQGYAENYNGSVPLFGRTVGYSRSYDVNGSHRGDTLNGSGFPGLPGVRAGLSGTATDTTLLGGQCGSN